MSDLLKALVVILGLATVVFAFAKTPACALASTTEDFERRRNLWFAITLTAFLAHNFWIYIVVVAALLLIKVPREPNKLAMFYFLLFAVPGISAPISGMGVMEQFFTINYVRLLTLAVLLPAFLSLRRQPDIVRFGRSVPDKLIAGYLILNFFLKLNVDTFTNSLRHGVFYAFVDIFLPYYVASRSLRTLQDFRDALMAFVIAALVLSAIGAFEFSRRWLLYYPLIGAFGMPWGLGIYLPRGEGLRAVASIGQPIPLGFVIAVAAGLFLYLKKAVSNPTAWGLGLMLLMIGLIAPLSRGPWVGAAAILLVFVATGQTPGLRFAKLGLLAVISLPVLLASPAGETIINYLPFVGTIEEENVTYRQRLLATSLQVIMQNPFFGTHDFLLAPAMQELRLPDGLIDIVNSYLGVALASGVVGLSLFSGFFIVIVVSIFSAMRKLTDRNGEFYLLGQVLFSTLVGILVMIFTVSSITVIPVIYWSLAGACIAYTRMLAPAKSPKNAEPVAFQQAPIGSGATTSSDGIGPR